MYLDEAMKNFKQTNVLTDKGMKSAMTVLHVSVRQFAAICKINWNQVNGGEGCVKIDTGSLIFANMII